MDEKTREELLALLQKCNPRTRRTVMHVIEGKVSQDNTAFIQEQLSMVEPDLTVRQVDFISSRTCDFGHLQNSATRLVAVCQVCRRHTCSAPGCSFTCVRCGVALCRQDAKTYDNGEVFCPRCRPFAWLRRLIVGKRT